MRKRFAIFTIIVVALGLFGMPRALAAVRLGVVGGASVSFEEATNDVRVTFRSMRLNRAQNVWNVDVTLTNASQNVLTAPVALFVESWSNTTGPLQVDGTDAGDGKPFFVFPVANELFSPSNTVTRTIALGVSGTSAPRITARAYSAIPGVTLALARTLDAAGQPIGGVRVEEAGPVETRVYATDAEAGVASVGQGAGPHVWKFSADGFLPVWRSEALTNGRVRMLVSPRLARRSTNQMTLTAGVENTIAAGEGVALRFAAAAFSAPAAARITVVDGQTLPALLPRGWSPMAAFTLEISATPAAPGVLTMAAPAGTGAVALAMFDEEKAGWVLNGIPIVNGAVMTAELPGAGSYALVLRDAEAGSGGLAIDELLPGVAAPMSVDLVAGGTVTPNKSRASVVPDLVTAQARVAVTNRGGALPSGLVLMGDISERYQLRNGTRRFPPVYDEFLVGYRSGGNAAAVEASFPMRPLLLFGADELVEATVRVDISAPTNFSGGVLGTNGGLLVNGNVRARSIAGDVASPQAALLRELDPTNFVELGGTSAVVVAGAELTIGAVASGRRLTLQFRAQETNSHYVLGKVVWRGGVYGVEPRERFQTDGSGNLASVEPASVARLRGVNGSGQYLLLKVPGPLAVVGGTATEDGAAAGSAIAAVDGQPWISGADASGKYTLVAPVGGATVRVRNFGSGKEAETAVTVPGDLAAVNADVTLDVPNLRIVSMTPAPGATNVSRIAQIVVNFSEAINPATLQGNLRLLGTNGQPVLGSLTLNLRNTGATFLPQAQLPALNELTVDVGVGISTPDGRALSGPRVFTFKTETDQLNRPPPQLISYEPVNGFAGLFGTPGTADPEAPVILVNETTGQTATILSKIDGSFTNSIAAGVDDILTAVLVNKNGTRTSLPVSKQMFRDGSVGLFNGGGILEAESDGGPVQVIVEPGSIESKTKFQVKTIPLGQLMALLETPPKDGVKVLGGVMMAQEGDDMKVGADISFPVDVDALGLTNAPDKCSWALATPREIDGVIVYEIVDRMQYEDGKLVTHSPPFAGALLKELQRRFKAAKKFDKMNRKISQALGIPDLKTTFYHVALLPLLMAQGTELIVQGKVQSMMPDAQGNALPGSERLLPGATITFAQDEFPDRPGRLQPGSTFTTAGSDGTYALIFPINRLHENGFVVRATHPAYPNQRASSPMTIPSLAQQFNNIAGKVTGPSPGILDAFSAIASAASVITPKVTANLEFNRYDSTTAVTTQEDAGPPVISMTVTPVDPGPGLDADDGAIITIAGNDDLQVGAIDMSLIDQFPLNPEITNNVVEIEEVSGSLTNIGTKFTQKAYRVRSEFRANVHLLVTVNDNAGNLAEAEALITFAGDRPPPPVNPNDTVKPRVLTSFPRNNATGIRPGQAVSIQFSEAIPRDAMANINTWLIIGGGAKFSSAELSRDAKQLSVSFAPDISGLVTLTINSGLTDLVGNPFDQDPITQGDQTFSMQFTVVGDTQNFAEIASGGGAVMLGSYTFLLERGGALDGALVAYDISSNTPVKLGEINLPGYPRDLALIPNYSFVMNETGSIETRNLVAVVGGKAGAETFQYLWIIDVTNPAQPKRVSGTIISLAIAAVTKVKWAPPILAYLEAGADITSVSIVDLQTMLIGMNATEAQAEAFPVEGDLGLDANHDGDYVDAGDKLPKPAKNPTEFYGKITALVDPDTDRRIEDFDIEQSGGLLGIVMSKGHMLGQNGLSDTNQPAKAAYRTLFSGLGALDPNRATLEFSAGSPKRVALFHQVLLEGDAEALFRNLAVVSLSESTNLVVIDITDPLKPREIARIDMANFGIPQTLTRRPDGLLAVATQERSDLYLFDPTKFLLAPVAGNPASLVGIIPGAGSGARSYVADTTGINIVNLGGRHSINHTAPDIRFLSFPNTIIEPHLIVGLSPETLDVMFHNARQESVLEKTRLFAQPVATNPPTLLPINTNALYYVRVDAVGSIGGGSGRANLVLEALNGSGLPLPNGGGASLPVRLAPTNTLFRLSDTNYLATNALPYQRELKAVRLSNDKGSKYYNVFLAGPFVLTDTALTSNQVTQVRNQQARGIVRAGRFLWAGLDESVNAAPYTTNVLSKVVANRLQQGDATVVNVAHVAKPLIFIPGIAGSYLWTTNSSTLDPKTHWLGYDFASALVRADDRHQQLSLGPGASPMPIAAPDVIRYVIPPTAVTPGLLPIYAGVLDYLKETLAYVDYDYRAVGKEDVWATHRTTTNALTQQIPLNPNLFVYPYDWRKDNAEGALHLKEYVRLIRLFNPEVEQIDILAHSMGGLIGRRFILDNPGVVDKFVTVGTPWLGAPKALMALETGDFDDFAMNFLIEKKTLRQLAEYFPGVQHLLPTEAFFRLGGSPLVEGTWDLNKNGTAGESYNYSTYKSTVDNTLHPSSSSPVETNQAFHGYSTALGGQDDWSQDSTGVDYYHIYGVQSTPDTIGRVKANLRLRPIDGEFQDLRVELPVTPITTNSAIVTTQKYVFDRRFEYVRVRGDGTVPELSAMRSNSFGNLNAPGAKLFPVVAANSYEDHKAEHNGMLANPKVLETIRDILNGIVEPPTNSPPPPPASFRITIANYKKGTIDIQDDAGENDDEGDLTFGQRLVKDVVGRVMSWLIHDDANRFTAEYELANTKGANQHTIKFEADTLPYSVDVEKIPAGSTTATERFRWVNVRPERSPAEITINWNQLGATLTAGGGFGAITPTFHLTGAAAGDSSPPTLTLAKSTTADAAGDMDDQNSIHVTMTDNVTPGAQQTLYLGFDEDGDGDWLNNIYYPIKSSLVSTTAPPTAPSFGPDGWKAAAPSTTTVSTELPAEVLHGKAAVAGSDSTGNVTNPEAVDDKVKPKGNPDCGTTVTINGTTVNKLQAERDAVHAAIKSAVSKVQTSQWILAADPNSTVHPGVWYILEQGSGACFWKPQGNLCDNCDGTFTAGVSDHDYEVFMPVFSPYSNGPPTGFANDPYSRANVTGDWYFLPPTVDGNFYVYKKPGGGGEIREQIKPGQPARTPANYITEEMVEEAVRLLKPNFPEAAKNLSMFSARAEHYEEGLIDLDRPLETGPDATGDAGLGRQSLLLKWVLEGEYVPDLDHVKNPPYPLADVFTKLQQRKISVMEGYEWAIVQEFTALSYGTLVRPANPAGAGAVPNKGNDYFYDIKKKHIKAAGKAAIRSTFGLLIAKAGQHVIISRAAYQQKPFSSFEAYIVEMARQNSAALGANFTVADVENFYKAKIADKDYLNTLLHDDLENNKFLAKAISFCRYVQTETEAGYQAALATLPADEKASREDNMRKVVVDGFPNLNKPPLDYLRRWPSLGFTLRATYTGNTAANNVKVQMTGDMQIGPVTVTVPKDGALDIPASKDSPPTFYVQDNFTQTTPKKAFITIDGSGVVEEGVVANNWLGFYYYMLDLVNPHVPAAVNTPLTAPTLPTPNPANLPQTGPFE